MRVPALYGTALPMSDGEDVQTHFICLLLFLNIGMAVWMTCMTIILMFKKNELRARPPVCLLYHLQASVLTRVTYMHEAHFRLSQA
jgi:hypothetical protein